MSVAPKTIVDAITAAPNPRSEPVVVVCVAGPINAIKLLIDWTNGNFVQLNAIIMPVELPPEKKRVAVAIANSAGLFNDLVLSRAWSTPSFQVEVWGDISWLNQMHQLLTVAALPQPVGTQIIIP